MSEKIKICNILGIPYTEANCGFCHSNENHKCNEYLICKVKNRRNTLIRDGVKEVPNEELHSFIAPIAIYPQRYGFITSLHVPIQIVRHLQLKDKDKVLVAIKKASPQEIQEYKQQQ